jgi:hypothetical protein
MHRALENFRALILLSLITLVVAVFLTFHQPSIAPAQADLFSRAGEDALVGYEWANYLWWCWFGIYTASLIAAFFYTWFARQLILAAICFGLVQVPLSGVSISTAWESAAWAVHSAVGMFAIGMAFFSPAVIRRMRRDWNRSMKL